MRNLLCGCLVGVLAFAALSVLVLFSGVWPSHATERPPSAETQLARIALDRSLARHAVRRSNPIQPTEENLLAGMKLFGDNCAGCHGTGTRRSHWGSANFYPPAPQFGFEPPAKPDWQLYSIVKHGVRYSGMAGWEGEMREDEIWKVVTFLTHLHSLPSLVASGSLLRDSSFDCASHSQS